MEAAVGDRIVVAAANLGGPMRDGEIIKVGSHGALPYLVRWSDDGRETLLSSRATRAGVCGGRSDRWFGGAPAATPHEHVKNWSLDLYLFEQGAATMAHAVLHTDAPTTLDSRGDTRRDPSDVDVLEIGDEVAAARALRRLAVVAMTGDGVNDAPALREAAVGVAMGLSGSEVTKADADLVLLDDHFATIVNAVELGRATFANVRRFLTYHLTDNVAELAPFAVWALTGGRLPLAIGVLQVLALDIGTDMLPALALGTEPPNRRIMSGRVRRRSLIDRRLLRRALLVLGVTEAVCALTTFVAVLSTRGWTWGATPAASTLAIASGSAFAAIALGQMANAFACRSEIQPVWRQRLGTNRLLIGAVTAELVLLGVFLGFPPLARLLGGSWPPTLGWALALCAVPIVILVDASYKALRRSRSRALALASVGTTSGGGR